MKKLSFLFVGLLLVGTHAQADFKKDLYLCKDKTSGEPVVEIKIVKNQAGVSRQQLTIKKELSVKAFAVAAGTTFFANYPPFTNSSNACAASSFIGVDGIDTQKPELIFFCDMESGDHYNASLAELICR